MTGSAPEVDFVGLGTPQVIHRLTSPTSTACGQGVVVLGQPETYADALLVRSRWKGTPPPLPFCRECRALGE